MNNIFNSVAVIIAAVIMACVLLSGRAEINFNHTPNWEEFKHHGVFKIQRESGLYSIYLSEEIKDESDYSDLIMWINQHKDEREIKVYLSGYGGSVASTLNLINTMRASPTKFTAVMYGNLYSAHAVLALNMDTIKYTNPNLFFMLHMPAVEVKGEWILLDKFCEKERGKNRGVSKKDKCFLGLKNMNLMADIVLFNKIKLMMDEKELKEYNKGGDVYFTAGSLINRGFVNAKEIEQ